MPPNNGRCQCWPRDRSHSHCRPNRRPNRGTPAVRSFGPLETTSRDHQPETTTTEHCQRPLWLPVQDLCRNTNLAGTCAWTLLFQEPCQQIRRLFLFSFCALFIDSKCPLNELRLEYICLLIRVSGNSIDDYFADVVPSEPSEFTFVLLIRVSGLGIDDYLADVVPSEPS